MRDVNMTTTESEGNAPWVTQIPGSAADMYILIKNKKYVLLNVHLPNALHSVCLNRLSCTEVEIYNNANSPNGFLTTAVV